MDRTIRVAIVDDNADVLDSLKLYLGRNGIETFTYASADKLLESISGPEVFDCVVSDVRMPKISGLELQQLLNERRSNIPLILVSGHGDIEMAVSTIKAGAFNFLEKPLDEKRLLDEIRRAVQNHRSEINLESLKMQLFQRYEQLSDRQRDVVRNATQGLSNKEIAAKLSISPRTVEHYREQAMRRMQAKNLAELIKMAMLLEVLDSKGRG